MDTAYVLLQLPMYGSLVAADIVQAMVEDFPLTALIKVSTLIWLIAALWGLLSATLYWQVLVLARVQSASAMFRSFTWPYIDGGKGLEL